MKFRIKIILDNIESDCQRNARLKIDKAINYLRQEGFELHIDKEFHEHSWMSYEDILMR